MTTSGALDNPSEYLSSFAESQNHMRVNSGLVVNPDLLLVLQQNSPHSEPWLHLMTMHLLNDHRGRLQPPHLLYCRCKKVCQIGRVMAHFRMVATYNQNCGLAHGRNLRTTCIFFQEQGGVCSQGCKESFSIEEVTLGYNDHPSFII